MILADHCVFAATVRALKDAGYGVVALKEVTDPSASDDEVLQLAISRDLILITNDTDFGNVLAYLPAQHQGVVVLKIGASTEAQVHRVLPRLLQDRGREGLRRRLAVVDHRKYRIRG